MQARLRLLFKHAFSVSFLGNIGWLNGMCKQGLNCDVILKLPVEKKEGKVQYIFWVAFVLNVKRPTIGSDSKSLNGRNGG